MRYRENSNKNDDSKLNEIIELVSSPYSLVIEISKKFFFLPRDLIEKILLASNLICLAQIIISSLLKVYFGSFSLLEGKFPLVFQIGVLIVLVFLYVAYELTDFSIYQNVDRLLPLAEKVSSEEFEQEANEFLEEMLDSLDLDDEDTSEIDDNEDTSEVDDNALELEHTSSFPSFNLMEDAITIPPEEDSDLSKIATDNVSLFSGMTPVMPIPVVPITPVIPISEPMQTPKTEYEEPVIEECVTEFSERYSDVVNKLASQMTYLGDISKASLQQIKDNVETNANKPEFQVCADVLEKTSPLNFSIELEDTIDRLKDWVTPEYMNEALAIGG